MLMNTNLSETISLWREHAQFFDHFAETVHLFHMPEVHDNIVESLISLIHSGNNHLRMSISKLLVAILANQYDPDRRAALTKTILEELGGASAFQLRKTFIYFCKECAGRVPSLYFVDNFYQALIKLAEDKVPHVRIEFAKALLDIKPYLDSD